MQAVAAAPVEQLKSVFMCGGALDRVDSPQWLFLAAAQTCTSLIDHVAGFQEALASLDLASTYSVENELVRSVHSTLTQLLLNHRLPHMLEDDLNGGKGQAVLNSDTWLRFADAAVAFERQVLKIPVSSIEIAPVRS